MKRQVYPQEKPSVKSLILELARCPRPLEKCRGCQEIVRELEKRGLTPENLRKLKNGENQFSPSEMGRTVEIKVINITDYSLEEAIRKVKELHWMGYTVDYDESNEVLVGWKRTFKKRVNKR